MPKNLKTLIAERDVLKGQVTKFETYLQTVVSRVDIGILELKLNRFDSILTDFGKLQGQIEILQDDDDDNERDIFEFRFYGLVLRARELMSEYKVVIPEVAARSQQIINLPKLNLPTFNGDITHWNNFIESFNLTIHNNNYLSDVQKFQYLISQLREEAQSLISNLSLTGGNYVIALELLNNRFNNPRMLVRGYIRNLLSLPELSIESANRLRMLIDVVQLNIRALRVLGEEVDSWGSLLVQIIESRLDTVTRKEWEQEIIAERNKIKVTTLIEFLERKSLVLENLNLNTSKPRGKAENSFRKGILCKVNVQASCPLCKGKHSIYICKRFQMGNQPERFEMIKGLRLCFNCLRGGHMQRDCNSIKCRKCNKGHHLLLHDERSRDLQLKNATVAFSSVCNKERDTNETILLGTALVLIKDNNGKYHRMRALIDTGSQINVMSKNCAKLLKLNSFKWPVNLVGLNDKAFPCNRAITAEIKSRVNAFTKILNFTVVNTVVSEVPERVVNIDKGFLKNYSLADPTFDTPGCIDLLLSSPVGFLVFKSGHKVINVSQNSTLILQDSEFGWMISGEIEGENSPELLKYNKQGFVGCVVVEDGLKKFWEIEEVDIKVRGSIEDEYFENQFVNTTERDPDGRFIVQMCTKNINEIGDTRKQATQRLWGLEKRMLRDKHLKSEYINFMTEYEQLGHMTETTASNNHKDIVYFLPHHGVIKNTSDTTKLRVVFDASAKSSTGVSLNDQLYSGISLQGDIFSLLTRFRKHKIALVADIEKMYRQIWIHPEQRNLQRILWRCNPNSPLMEYQLNTVTYGTASAPFLATRCLKQLAFEAIEMYPETSKIINEDFYMDDLITGASSEEEAMRIYNETRIVLASGGFHLRKWASNNRDIFKQELNIDQLNHYIVKSDCLAILGVQWNLSTDEFSYKIDLDEEEEVCNTKRELLSQISRIFDPLGLVGPVTVKAKLLIQELWRSHLNWDDKIPDNIIETWVSIRNQLPILNECKISRTILQDDLEIMQFHGFCDASERAYGAVVYVRTVSKGGIVNSLLLGAKSRIAPLKIITLPRLELCAAILLKRLMTKIKGAWHSSNIIKVYYWSDSTITLAWIKADPTNWKTFVANRVSEIQGDSDDFEWNHIKGKENPADIISRGMSPEQLRDNNLWWNGPEWLSKSESLWPLKSIAVASDLPERRKQNKIVNVTTLNNSIDSMVTRYSSIERLSRITAYCLRFGRNTRVNELSRNKGNLSPMELDAALLTIIKIEQGAQFQTELDQLNTLGYVKASNRFSSLNPILDNLGIIRVGGRLKQANILYDQKHPVLLPHRSHLTDLIVRNEHEKLLHAGQQAVQASLYQRYWIISSRGTIRRVIRNCMICSRYEPRLLKPLMGDLPHDRINQGRAFQICGVDYAGPFLVKERMQHNRRFIKVYICIFVCFVTRAIHIEIVSDLTTDAFLNALKRFISRRGKCSKIYSDNGTNFVGAAKELKELTQGVFNEQGRNRVTDFCANEQITWKFSPPRSPHFGGLWEAAVKSMKRHLYKTVGNAQLSMEGLNTVLVQVEAVLNSRPLTSLSSDPNDLSPLTPGHFLIGEALIAPPQKDVTSVPTNRLKRYQQWQGLLQHFWNRWSREYISTLQERHKWTKREPQKLAIGDLVLIQEDSPPLRWPLGRVIELHTGGDSIDRVATIKTATGAYKRAVNKLVRLPKPTEGDDRTSE